MPKKPEEILKDLSAGKFSPFYFLMGEESFYIDKISDYIEENALEKSERSFNQTVLYGKDIQMKDIISQAKQFPVMAMRQVVIVKEAQEISDFGRETAKTQLQNYAEKAVPTTVLVFLYKHKKLALNTKLAKAIDKHAILVESKPLYENQVPAWIGNYLQQKKYRITPDATAWLIENVGIELSRLANEIDKLLLNFGKAEVGSQPSQITTELVKKYIGTTKEYNVFDLQRAIAQRNSLKTHKIINTFAANPKDNPVIPIVSSLFGYFCKLILIHKNQGKSNNELAGILKVSPFFVKDYSAAARNYNIPKILFVLHALRIADAQSKGINSSAKDEEILRELAVRILG
ncbi:DNA polymerase III subunit delta [Bernardetia sp. Wsw4-3y2]|uniref:DNA polymerase III subunit delta n=1 Tax=Bernardetia sp. Wsw4-3y2 TaxID=3127471 RepID=UPI0030D3F114